MKKNKQRRTPKFKIEDGISTSHGHANVGNTYEDKVDLSYSSEPMVTRNQTHKKELHSSQVSNQNQILEPKKEKKVVELEKTLTIKKQEPAIKISGNLPEKTIIGNTFTGNVDFSHNQIINQQIKHIQGFNIEGSNNTFTNPSIQGNTMEIITYEEEEPQTAIESPLPPKQLK